MILIVTMIVRLGYTASGPLTLALMILYEPTLDRLHLRMCEVGYLQLDRNIGHAWIVLFDGDCLGLVTRTILSPL
jgi:hypothetical protein